MVSVYSACSMLVLSATVLQILYSGLYRDGSAYGVGEQAELYFSHESARAQMVKTMALEQSEDTLTHSGEDWAETKRQGMAAYLAKRYQ